MYCNWNPLPQSLQKTLELRHPTLSCQLLRQRFALRFLHLAHLSRNNTANSDQDLIAIRQLYSTQTRFGGGQWR